MEFGFFILQMGMLDHISIHKYNIGIDRLTITPEIFDSGGIHSYGHVLFGGIQ